MEILEFGDKSKRKIVLIHGFQCPVKIWDKYIEHYKNDFHIIVPILPGHNPQKQEKFISFSETAKEFEDYFISNYEKDIYAIYGISIGGIFAASIWENTELNIENLIFDGSPLVSYPKILKRIFTNFYLNVTHKTRARDEKTLKQATNGICPEEALPEFLDVLDNMSDENIINYIDKWGKYRMPIILKKQNTQIYYFHGTKMNEMLAKKSAKYLTKYYSSSRIKCFKERGHCEISLFHPELMIEELDKIIKV